MLIVDAHEDIAWNMLTFGRDYTRGVQAIRKSEANTPIPTLNGHTLLGLDAWLSGKIAIIFATLFAAPIRHGRGQWDKVVYRDAQEAYKLGSMQLDTYRRLADQHPVFRIVGRQTDLDEVLASWSEDEQQGGETVNAEELSGQIANGQLHDQRQIGLVPLMEGADPVLEPEQVEEWYERGVRLIGLAWEATRYAGGTHEPGPLTSLGYHLLEIMAELGVVLDLSHLSEKAYFQALETYEGIAIASHANPRRFLPTSRGLSDEMIELLAARGGVVGVVPYNAFLKPGWHKGDPKAEIRLATVADVIDHICQLTGSVIHVGIGSDFDGGFGYEHVPAEIETVADLQKLDQLLAERGYTPDQIADILGGNWLRILRRVLPD